MPKKAAKKPEVKKPEWTKGKPTAPGWYFWKKAMTVKKPEKFGCFYVSGSENDVLPKFGAWYGPVEIG